MKKFKFRLESVQKLRETREQEALRNLAAAQRALQTEIEKKEIIKRDLESARARLESLGETPTGIAQFQVEQNFIDGSVIRLRHADTLIRRAERSVEKSMAAYQVARKNLRMIETLREKAYQEYLDEGRRKEQVEADDLTSMRHRFKEEELWA